MTTAPPHRLAILTVVRNDLAGLIDTHDSLRGQLGPRIAWLVADGGSTDGTAEWLAERGDPPVWWRSAPDLGIFAAMNDGLDAARRLGFSHVLFLNAGDRLAAADCAVRLLQAAGRRPDAALFYGDALERQGDGRILLKRARSHRWAAFGMFTHHQAMIYSVSALAGLHFDPAFRIASDYAFTLATLGRGPAVRLRWPVCLFAPGGLSQRDAATGRREQESIRRMHLGQSPMRAAAISALQWIALAVRHHFPTAYAKLRFRRPEI